ncbi:SapC family protein [Shewanella marina]|uniref:SapC family protein n=1 Tax=Shewanella marina TaxID=487319 RepID=UPI0004702738|nr:SapC family protein [Shewanella marina]
MSQQIELLDHNKHGHIKLGNVDYSFMQEQHLSPITLHEFPMAAIEHPIVFVKNAETGEFQAVVMLGLKPGINMSVKQGKWTGLYQPHVVRDYPLGLIFNPEVEDKVWIGIRENGVVVDEQNGQALFDGEAETDYLTARKKALVEHYQQDVTSKRLFAKLAEMGLLESQTLTVEVKGEKRNINGIYLINEANVNKLTDEQFAELRQLGLLGPIYSHLTSLHQIHRLARTEALS